MTLEDDWTTEEASMNVKDLCGANLCMTASACSYELNGRRVFLCNDHLVKLSKESGHPMAALEHLLPMFEWERACPSCGSFEIHATESACLACSRHAARDLTP